ncbi:PREDICTED: guanylate cyclase 2G-like [Priapulus caudatus]|uniref:Guanylate cyclase 2G-like n=1 Tax=Priapulus caudatus TaxID=37621 RepID=A0ABM1EYJ9_PRICU|nr:PREDICTED: guanylate cyclase 2G-like [Priapulus caudatus]
MWWKVMWADITLQNTRRVYSVSLLSFSAMNSQRSDETLASRAGTNKPQQFATFAVYKARQVVIKRLGVKQLVIKKSLLVELNELRQLQHDNINRIVGIVTDEQLSDAAILTDYCQKGSLQYA